VAQQSKFSAAHLRAVQAGDLGTARQLDGSLSEASNSVRIFTQRLRDHEAAHRGYNTKAAGA